MGVVFDAIFDSYEASGCISVGVNTDRAVQYQFSPLPNKDEGKSP